MMMGIADPEDPKPNPEAELVRRARSGETAAWEALVDAHRQAVFRLAYLLSGSAADAEDVAQETFLRAYHALGRFDTGRPLRPWLLKITANQARNQRRSLGRYAAALTRWFQSDPQTSEPGVEAASRRRQDRRQVWEAVRRLSDGDQRVIYLRYFLELSVEETADTLEIAPGTVKSRLHRALGRLRRVVEREFPELGEESRASEGV
jgi:RNA polymerase sigma-70 factor (ECF subfamily)